MLIDTTLKEFNDLLLSKEPAPGGGSAAALASLLGAALSVMVAHLSFGRKAYEALSDELKENFESDFRYLQVLNEDLLKLVDEDTQAYKKVMRAMKLPKDTQEQRTKRDEAMKKANTEATQVPLMVARKSLEILRHQSVIAQYGNKNAASDIGVGAILALAGLEGAILNVKTNLSGISDNEYADEITQKIDSYVSEGAALKSEIMKIAILSIG